MPANLTPQYYEAEEAYKKATTIEEKIRALQEMLAVIPKHKGTDKLQGDIKKKISKLKKEIEQNSKGKKTGFDPFNIEKQGAGQVFVLGYPNCGKSAFVGALTNAKTNVQDFPFSTSQPVVGMIPFEEIYIQLIDTPPITEEGIPGNFSNALRHCDLILALVDLSSDSCVEQLQGIIDNLRKRNLLVEKKSPKTFTLEEIIFIGTKSDHPQAYDNLQIIYDLIPNCPEILPISLYSEELKNFPKILYEKLDVVRIYTKAPGKKPDFERPYVLKKGSTVMDLALEIHKDIAANLKSARVWGSAKFPGQSVEHSYILADKDIVELLT